MDDNFLKSGDSGDYKKPGYDGRLHYQKTLGELNINIMACFMNEEWQQFLELCRLGISYISAFVRKEALDRLDKSFKIAQNTLVTYSLNYSDDMKSKELKKKLDDLFRSFIIESKHLLMPISDEDTDEWDEDAFKAGSDLA